MSHTHSQAHGTVEYFCPIFERVLNHCAPFPSSFYSGNSLSGSDRRAESDAECSGGGAGSDGGFLWRNRKRRLLESRLRKAEEESAALRAEVEKKDEMLAAKQKAVKIMQAQVSLGNLLGGSLQSRFLSP